MFNAFMSNFTTISSRLAKRLLLYIFLIKERLFGPSNCIVLIPEREVQTNSSRQDDLMKQDHQPPYFTTIWATTNSCSCCCYFPFYHLFFHNPKLIHPFEPPWQGASIRYIDSIACAIRGKKRFVWSVLSFWKNKNTKPQPCPKNHQHVITVYLQVPNWYTYSNRCVEMVRFDIST